MENEINLLTISTLNKLESLLACVSAGSTYADLIEYLSNFGKVLTEHIGDSMVVESEEGLSDQEIFTRDMDWLQSSDQVIAEVSTPSLGVGFEIGMAQAYGKKILCLFRLEKGTALSAMIAGNPNVKVQGYKTEQEAKELISAFLDYRC